MKEYGIQKLFTNGVIYTLNVDGTRNIIIDDVFKHYSHERKMAFKTNGNIAKIYYYSPIINSKLLELNANNANFKFEMILILKELVNCEDCEVKLIFDEANIENIDISADADGCLYDTGIVIQCVDKWKFEFDEIK